MSLMSIMVASSAALAFNCNVTAPHIVSAAASTGQISQMDGLPPEALTFSLRLTGNDMQVAWPDSPIQLDGRSVIIPTGEMTGSALFVSAGPCLFTEAACGNMLSFARQPDGQLLINIVPTAFARDENGVRTPFFAIIEGRCLPSEARR